MVCDGDNDVRVRLSMVGNGSGSELLAYPANSPSTSNQDNFSILFQFLVLVNIDGVVGIVHIMWCEVVRVELAGRVVEELLPSIWSEGNFGQEIAICCCGHFLCCCLDQQCLLDRKLQIHER